MKILAAMKKEWLLLWRDKIGLVILFILPMCLVLFISMTTTDQAGNNKHNHKFSILLLDQDKGTIAKGFITALNKISLFKVVTQTDNPQALQQTKKAVINGDYPIAIVIPADTTKDINQYLQKQLRKPNTKIATPDPIQLYLDPGLQVQVKDSIVMSLRLITSQIETATMQQLLGQTLHQPNLKLSTNFIDLKTNYVNLADDAKSPNNVQYNVPAWTLFGMFFIVIPLAGVMVRERELGVYQRLEIAPTWHLNLMLGRIFAFVGLNMVQLWLMLAVGVYILPLFDMPTLEVANHIGLIFITGIFASLAATGFGLLIGTWASTYEQATVLGPFLIVIAAAIGGIMAPIDLMPSLLQKISGYSPLNWAQTSFLDIFVRDAKLHQILPELAKLFGFFVLTLTLSLTKFLHPKALFNHNH
jgi:ABC-2 type transport system permease protein